MTIDAFNSVYEFVCTNSKIHVFKYRVSPSIDNFIATTGTLIDDKLTEGYILMNEHNNSVIFRTIEKALNCVPINANHKWKELSKFALGTIIGVNGNYYLVVELMNNAYFKDKYKVIQLKSESEGYGNTMHILKEDNIVIRNGSAVFTLE